MGSTNVTMLLIGLITIMFTPVMIGHGLGHNSLARIGIGLICLVVGAGIVLAHVRGADKAQQRSGGRSAH